MNCQDKRLRRRTFDIEELPDIKFTAMECEDTLGLKYSLLIVGAVFVVFSGPTTARATTKGLSQIVTPDLQEEGDLSLSLQIQDKRIANPYQLQAEFGIT